MNDKINFISAGAGSGKTYRLTEILHEQLSSGPVRPAGVIATTFTKKAATELRERVRSHLFTKGDYRLANAMGQARIGTINGVCGGLLERFAFEAGLATEQQVLEEGQTRALIKQAIDAVLDGQAIADFLRVVRRLGLDLDNSWQNELKTLVDQARANDIPIVSLLEFADANAKDLLSHFPKPTKVDLSQKLRKAIAAALPKIAAQAESGGKKNTTEYLSLIRAMARALDNNYATWSEWVKLSKTWPEASLTSLAEPINELAARFSEHPGLHQDIRDYLTQMFALCADALAIYAERKREMGVLDFADQEHLLLKVLDDSEVASVLQDELDLLLVDEFQDTSPIQLALFIKLAHFAKAVYWVGDIKQAIYGFRGSDTVLMESILQALPGLGGKKEILNYSYRSRPDLVHLVNVIFNDAFSGSLTPEEIVLKPKRSDETEGLCEAAFANWLLGGKNLQQEKSALAAGIRQLVQSGYKIYDKTQKHARPVRYGDIAILSRTNIGVTDIATALRNEGIPSATTQPGLMTKPEIKLALACLRRLHDSSDTIATAEIVSLADGTAPETWIANRLTYLDGGGQPDRWMEAGADGEGGHPLMTLLAEMRNQLPLLAPAEALRAVITECDLPSIVLRWTQDDASARIRLSNLETLLELAVQYEDVCRSSQLAASVSGLILWFGEIAEEELDYLAEPAIDAVKVMTHHAAKGLEWPVVVLTDLSANIKDRLWSITAGSKAGIDAQDPLRDRFIRYWPWPFAKQKKVEITDEIALTETAKLFRSAAIEESKRLLYVSMTRARDLLILARSSRKPTGEWLDVLNAPWLLPGDSKKTIILSDGKKVQNSTLILDPVETPGVKVSIPKPLYWFESDNGNVLRDPLVFNPSSSNASNVETLEKIYIADRISIKAGVDMASLGTAIHACIAYFIANRLQPLELNSVERILQGQSVSDHVAAADVLKNIHAFGEWTKQRWGQVEAYAEYPVQSVMQNGQILQGRIDLLLKTSTGLVLIDHKSSPFGVEQWEHLASEYASQMAMYARAISAATGDYVAEYWLFLPVSGGGVRFAIT